jgi:two-component system nitrate/nitrite response regulator NarL
MMTTNATLALVEADRFARQGLAQTLERFGFQVEICHDSLADLLADQRCVTGPDLIVADWDQLRGDLPDQVAKLAGRFPGSRLVVRAHEVDPEVMRACYRAGVCGYVSKRLSERALIAALTLVEGGERVYPADILEQAMADGMAGPAQAAAPAIADGELSAREYEILRHLVTGESNKEIARKLDITEATVKVHLRNLLKKLNAANRTQLAVWALRGGGPRSGRARGRNGQDADDRETTAPDPTVRHKRRCG